MDQYRTSGTFNEAAVKETAKIYVPSWYRWLNRVFCVFSFLVLKKLGPSTTLAIFSATYIREILMPDSQ